MMKEKLKSKTGETLTEALVSVLLVAVSTVIFLSMVATAGNMNRKQQTLDAAYLESQRAVECWDEGAEGAKTGRATILICKNKVATNTAAVSCETLTVGELSAYRAEE